MSVLPLRAGADGWRGEIGPDFTPARAAVLARCAVTHLGASAVLVTHDSRRAGAEAAAGAARAAAAAGARSVRLVPHLPTPTVTAAVRSGRFDAAVLITASHNPPRFNGVKLKVAPGGPPSGEVEHAITALFGNALAAGAEPVGRDSRPDAAPDTGAADLIELHLDEVLGRVRGLCSTPLSVTVDGLGGVAGRSMARLCERLGWRVTRVACAPDPDFGGLVPDPSVPASRARAAAHDTDLALVLDGDGDRLFVIDGRGRTVQPHELLALLLEHRVAAGLGWADIAVTVSTGTAARLVATELGGRVHETSVGFKHLSPLMAAGVVAAAGGAVGDLGFVEFGLDRDPFAAVVLLADLLDTKRLDELLDDLRARTGDLRWFEFTVGHWPDGAGALRRIGLHPIRTTDVDGVKYWLADGQWLLLRASTTEGGFRVYGELRDEEHAAEVRRFLNTEDHEESHP